METSLLVARILAVMYLAVGLGMLINKTYYQNMLQRFSHETPLFYVGGVMALIAGFLIITFHNLWVKDWTVLVTIVGWLAMVKGIMLLLLPKTMTSATHFFLKPNMWPLCNGFVLLLGLVMGYFGFVA